MAGFKYPKGSEWRKWDLHVHTFASYDWDKDCIATPEDIVNKALAENLSVIAITDHHTVKSIDEIVKAANGKNLTVLPGVELRTDKGNKGIHIIGIFDVSVFSKTIYDKLLCPLDFSENDIKTKGDEQIYCNFESACQKIHELGGIVMLHAGNKSSGIEQLDSDIRATLKKDLASLVDIFEVSNQEQVDKYRKIVFPKIKREFPCIITSDAYDRSKTKYQKGHSIELIGKKYSWVKANPTFEGLKQIIYEPDLRIKVQSENPMENEIYSKVEACIINLPSSLKIKTEEYGKKTDFCLQGKYELEFSNNLTCVIGGRGSGKSTLVHLLYNTWLKKNIKELVNLNSPLLSLDLPPDPLKQVAELTTAEIPIDTEFFLQNEIEKIAKDVNEMSNLIRQRLHLLSFLDSQDNQKSLKDFHDEWSLASRNMKELIDAYDNVSTINQKIELIKKQIATLKKQISVIKSEEYKNFQKEIEDINKEISAFKHYKDEYTQLIKKIDMLIADISQLDWNEEQGKNILVDLLSSLQNYGKRLKENYSSLERKFEANNYSEQIAKKKLQLKKYLTEKGLPEENIEELANALEQIKQMEGEIIALEKQKAPFDKSYSERNSRLEEYKKKYSAYHDRFFKVVTRLQKELEGLPFFDREISFASKNNEQHLREAAVEFVKQNSPAKVTLRVDDIQAVLFDIDNIGEYIKNKEKIRDCVNKSTKTFLHKQVLQELVNNPVFLEQLYLRFWKDYYDIDNIQVQTKLGEKLLQNTSFGERCGIVISIVLVAGTNPIVIDQPEDNLDGKFISTVLVPLIRKRKHYRQIILVTRDANIVIGGDAELIHILEGDGQKTKIILSAIENIECREKYIWILDGGKEAFEKRERKYGFKIG